VLNESGNHSVPEGSETHFKVVVASGSFEGQSAVQRHRAVFALLKDELRTGLHALALHAKTPHEHEADAAAQRQAVPSPPCLGGSKAESSQSNAQ